jgi:hypothetical protein
MRRFLFGFLAIFLFGCTVRTDSSAPNTASLPDLGPTPELTNDSWLNVDSPLRLADLRGKVVLIDMWTFG